MGCILGNIPAVKALLDLGADPNIQDSDGNTALHHACNYEHESIVELLLEKSCSIDIKNNKEQTPIECIQSINILEIVKADPKYGEKLI